MRIVVLLLTLPLFLSCATKSSEDIPFQYPLNVGNWWEYDYQFTSTIITDDTIFTEADYESVVTILVTQRDAIEGNSCFALYSDEVSRSGEEYTGFEWSGNEHDGLYLYAYNGSSSGRATPSPSRTSILLSFGNYQIQYENLLSYNQLTNFFLNPSAFSITDSDTIYIEDYPVRTLIYPLEVGSGWGLRPEQNPWMIYKRVVGYEIFEHDSLQIWCYVIQWLYDMDDDSRFDEDVSIVDYISEFGLVKRDIYIEGEARDELNNIIGIAEFRAELVLRSYRID